MTHKLGEFFTLKEMTRSTTAAQRGIPNEPDEKQLRALELLVVNILDPLRRHAGRPVIVTSGLRVPALNRAVGGSATSQHVLGEAADIKIPGMAVADVCAVIRTLNLPFDQLIDEFGSWVHVSHGSRHRRQSLRARKQGGRTVYLQG